MSVEGNLIFRGSIINGEVSLLSVRVTGQVNCIETTIVGVAKDKEEPEKLAAFSADKLSTGGGLSFRAANLKGQLRISAGMIAGQVSFSEATLDNGTNVVVHADGLTASGDVFIDEATVTGEVRFIGARIQGQFCCAHSTISNKGERVFSGDLLSVDENLIFRDATITGEIVLAGAKVGRQLTCRGATFDNEGANALTWERLQVRGEMFFLSLKEQVKGRVIFNHAYADVFISDNESWPQPGHVDLEGFQYRTLGFYRPWKNLLEWIRLQPVDDFTPQPYEQAIKVYRESGHLTDARAMGVAKEDAYRTMGGLSLRHRAWLWFLKVTIAYGYKPWRAVFIGLFIIALSTAIFAAAFDRGVMTPTKERVYLDECYLLEKPTGSCTGWHRPARWWVLESPIRMPTDYPGFNPLAYSLDTFLPIVDLHQEAYWMPRANHGNGGFFRIWLLLQIATGWVLTTLAIAALTGLVKKD